MTEQDNLVLELLRGIRDTLNEHSEQFRQTKEQFQSIQLSLHALGQKDLAQFTENAKLNHDVQELSQRLDRIERRLEIRDKP